MKPPEASSNRLAKEEYSFYGAPHFHHMLRIERLRTERSRKPFLLMLVDISGLRTSRADTYIREKVKLLLVSCSRETDIRGWYEQNAIAATIFTDMPSVDEGMIEIILRKLEGGIGQALSEEDSKRVKVSFHPFPESNGNPTHNSVFNVALYPDISGTMLSRLASSPIKKLMDVLVSLFVVLFFSPIFLAIAAAIKLTSPGPVFFKQERMGLNGRKFTCLKFRSMYADNDGDRHRNYIKEYIAESEKAADAPGVYKISDDPRITPIGHFLRKTSLDELPQFINVIKGEMSLVGPRPPIPYEFELYDIWHRRRLLSAKPGITGLWQVFGRSRTTFGEMVRLDLKYINDWSLWLDIKLLLATSWVMLTGRGAY